MSIKNIVIAQTSKITAYNPTTGQVEGIDTTTGNITANTGYYFLGDGGLLSNISGGGGGTPNAIANGTGTLSIALDSGNLSITNPGGSGDANLNFNNDSVAIGYNVGTTNQGANAIAIGVNAGTLNQPANSIMLNASPIELNGTEEGFYVNPMRGDIGNVATAVYYNSSTYELTFAPTVSATIDWANVANKSGASGPDTVAIGNSAALIGTQGANAVAIGVGAGRSNQDGDGVAIGTSAGLLNQSNSAVAIGRTAGLSGQGEQAVAIGTNAGGTFQGANAVAIGPLAGQTSQPANSIMINAGETALNGTEEGFYVQPVRNDTGNTTNVVYYNTSTNEVTYGPAGGGGSYGNSDVSTYLASNANVVVTTTGNITTTANISANNFLGTGAFINLNSGMLASNAGSQFINVSGGGTGDDYVSLGFNSGFGNQTITLGLVAGGISPGTQAIAIGATAGQFQMGSKSIAIGANAGAGAVLGAKLGANSIAIGSGAARDGSAANVIILNATGADFTPSTSQPSSFYVNPVRNDTGNTTNVVYYNTSTKEVTYGPVSTPSLIANGTSNVTIDTSAGNINFNVNGNATGVISASQIAIGANSGTTTQGGAAVAIGLNAGSVTQASESIAIGNTAGFNNQATDSVAIGRQAGATNQGQRAVAIGPNTGGDTQGAGAVAIGYQAGGFNMGANSVAIGYWAGRGSGAAANSVAIGAQANAVIANSIMINATGARLDTGAAGFHVAPVRSANVGGGMMSYNATTKEVLVGIPQLPAFADLTEMTSAVTSPVAGMMAYDTANNRPAFYNGTSWTDL